MRRLPNASVRCWSRRRCRCACIPGGSRQISNASGSPGERRKVRRSGRFWPTCLKLRSNRSGSRIRRRSARRCAPPTRSAAFRSRNCTESSARQPKPSPPFRPMRASTPEDSLYSGNSRRLPAAEDTPSAPAFSPESRGSYPFQLLCRIRFLFPSTRFADTSPPATGYACQSVNSYPEPFSSIP